VRNRSILAQVGFLLAGILRSMLPDPVVRRVYKHFYFLSSFKGLFFAALLMVGSVHAQPVEHPRPEERLNRTEFDQKMRLAVVYEETHDLQNALRLYEELYRQDSTSEPVFEGYTRLLIAAKRYSEAKVLTQARLKFDPSLDNVLQSARLTAMLNDRPGALREFQSAIDDLHATDCSTLFPVVYAMMDVSYNQDALELLDKMRKLGGGDADLCSSQIASLYLRLGDYDRAGAELLTLVRQNEGNANMVEQRLAQYTTDSVSRSAVLGALERQILSSESTSGTLRLLAWVYGELKDYRKALAATLRVDQTTDINRRGSAGFELMQFGDRARNEGALDVAVDAYDEAIKRFKAAGNNRQDYYIAQAELGALRTREALLASKAATKDEITDLIARYESYAQSSSANELAVEALYRAGDVAYHQAFDLDRATKDLESTLTKTHGMSDRANDAAFLLVDIAMSGENFTLAEQRLQAIDKNLASIQRRPNELTLRMHVLYDRALLDYYQGNFDSAASKLDLVAQEASNDFANDAIQLLGLLGENNNPTGQPALRLYAKASLAAQSRKYEEARAAYASIVETQSFAPLADDAALKEADMLVLLGKPADAVQHLEVMQEKMSGSPMLDVALFREAEIVERMLHDKVRAERLYEDMLARFTNSGLASEARERARKLRGDVF
jgi:tetratricopeptide (TPR) repeat protein